MPIDDPIVIRDHDPAWARVYASESARLLGALGDLAAEIHHIGSTSVPGLPAKPVVDVLVGARRPVDGVRIAAVLRLCGYEEMGEFGIPGRLFFRRDGDPALHVHVFAAGHPSIARDLGFRDRLRGDPEIARAYASMKRDLAARHRLDRPAYSLGKEEFIVRLAGPRPAPRLS